MKNKFKLHKSPKTILFIASLMSKSELYKKKTL